MKSLRVRRLVAALSFLVVLVSCDTPAATQAEVIDLGSVDQLAEEFNQVGTVPKLILLLSPT